MITLFTHCTRDAEKNVEEECEEIITYNSHVKTIIDGSCAYTGCHVPGTNTFDYSSYEKIQGSLTDGTFEEEVFRLGEMPPMDGIPLNDDQLHLLKCWMQDGYLKEI